MAKPHLWDTGNAVWAKTHRGFESPLSASVILDECYGTKPLIEFCRILLTPVRHCERMLGHLLPLNR
jgi:hypothetical protein